MAENTENMSNYGRKQRKYERIWLNRDAKQVHGAAASADGWLFGLGFDGAFRKQRMYEQPWQKIKRI